MKNVECVGLVTSLNRDIFKVSTDNGSVIKCFPSGKIRLNSIQIIEGDKVLVKVSANDSSVGIITRRISK